MAAHGGGRGGRITCQVSGEVCFMAAAHFIVLNTLKFTQLEMLVRQSPVDSELVTGGALTVLQGLGESSLSGGPGVPFTCSSPSESWTYAWGQQQLWTHGAMHARAHGTAWSAHSAASNLGTGPPREWGDRGSRRQQCARCRPSWGSTMQCGSPEEPGGARRACRGLGTACTHRERYKGRGAG